MDERAHARSRVRALESKRVIKSPRVQSERARLWLDEEHDVAAVLIEGGALLEVAHEQLKRRLDQLGVRIEGEVEQDGDEVGPATTTSRRLHLRDQGRGRGKQEVNRGTQRQ